MAHIKLGTIILNKYEIINVDFGQFGVVYSLLNLDRQDFFEEQFLCLKTYKESSNDPYMKAVFIDEIENWMLLGKYDLTLNAFKLIFLDEVPYVVLQYADSGTLADLAQRGYAPWVNGSDYSQGLLYVWHFMVGLRYIYNKLNRLHGDLKIENIFLTLGGKLLKIGDFGLVGLIDNTAVDNVKSEANNIVRIVNFLLTGEQTGDNWKKPNHLPAFPIEKMPNLSTCHTKEGLFEAIDIIIDILKSYFHPIGCNVTTPEEYHAERMNQIQKQFNDLLSPILSSPVQIRHFKRPEHSLDESDALYYAGNKAAALDSFLEYRKNKPKK